ncbi:hypothetical protein, partial [Paracoccus sp. FO-3]|uniref:hypothetical protein n=1 Tax=Paracoccus sp. FO-3 TaxID=1335059 RepID=UPI001C614AD3
HPPKSTVRRPGDPPGRVEGKLGRRGPGTNLRFLKRQFEKIELAGRRNIENPTSCYSWEIF